MSKLIFDNLLKHVDFRHSNHSKLYGMEFLKAWDYAETIFRSDMLQIPYPKAEIGTTNNIFDILKIMYVYCCVCHICMYGLRVSYKEG